MRHRSLLLICLMLAIGLAANGQDKAPETLLPYLHGLRAKTALLLNIQGYEIIAEEKAGSLAKPWFSKMFPGFGLRKGYTSYRDSSLGMAAYRAEQQEEKTGPLSHFVTEYYFIEKSPSRVIGLSITGYKGAELSFKRALAHLILEDKVPDSLLSQVMPPSVRFVDRILEVDSRCQWRNAAALQCHGFGEMNWSMHPNMQEAEEETRNQKAQNADFRKLEIEKEEAVQILFEGQEVTAVKQQLRAKGVTGIRTQMEGSRTLIAYYVSAAVRGRYVSCVLSHWTSDYLENGLPPLLNTVMSLKQ